MRAVLLSARRDIEARHFHMPHVRFAGLSTYWPEAALHEPTVVDAAWLPDGTDLSRDTEVVVLPHWRADRPWIPDGRFRFPRVTALGRPALQSVLEERLLFDGVHASGAHSRDALRDLARTFLVEKIDVEPVATATPAEFESWLAEPAELPSLRVGLPRGLYLLWSVRKDLQRAFPSVPGEDEARLIDWARRDPLWAGDANTRMLAGFTSNRLRRLVLSKPSLSRRSERFSGGETVQPQSGVLVFGLLNTANGLGNVARDLVVTLQTCMAGKRISLRTWDPDSQAKIGPAVSEGPPREIAIAVHGGQSDYANLVDRDFMRADRRIGVVFWELDCPIPGVDDFDRIYTELWAPSTFLAEVYRRQTDLPVHVMPQYAEFTGADPQEVSPDWRGREDQYALFVFDHYSVMERKNPTGVIDAFVAAVAPSDGARLVIKAINGERYRREHAELARRAARYSHVEVIDGFIPRAELLRLSAGASAYVSLHRGEGLGLTIAEAMAMGVPAVATAFGGNLDFMDGSNSLLVDYQTKLVGDEGFPYPGDAFWADPDIDLAAAHITALLSDRDRASEIGSRGRHHVLQCFSRERQVAFLRQQGVTG